MKGFKINFDWLPIFDGEFASFDETEDAYNSIMAIFCVICAGLAAGLTMGMVSLDLTKLEVKTLTGSPSEQRDAKSVLPIVKRHHFLLVTLLLFNSISNESLPIFLGALFPNWVAILISVTMVLIFGEILPSALFTGTVQLRMAAYFAPFVLFLMTMFWPIAYPISKILDFIFGAEEHTSALSRDDFQALVTLQGIQREKSKHIESGIVSTCPYSTTNESTPLISDRESQSNSNTINSNLTFHCNSIEEGYESHNSADDSTSQGQYQLIMRAPSRDPSYLSHSVRHERDGSLSNEELSILTGVLRLSNRTVHDVMIPMSEVCMLSDTNVLNCSCLNDILSTGYSRIPVYRGLDSLHIRIRGYLLVKSLAVLNPDDETPLNSLALREPIFLRPNVSLLEALGTFRRTRCHIAIVCDDPIRAVRCMRSEEFLAYEPKMLGIITMEDCIEEIIQDEIEDETDVVRTSGSFTPLNQNIAVGSRRRGSISERETLGTTVSVGDGGFTSRGNSRPTTPSLTGRNLVDLGLNTVGLSNGSSVLRHTPNTTLPVQGL